MEVNQEVAVGVIKNKMKSIFILIGLMGLGTIVFSQEEKVYKKRVLESTEVDFLMSYYAQDGENAAVTGGIGTEELTDITPTIVISIPLNDDDVLTIDAGISAYTSASSSNVNALDIDNPNAFTTSTGASGADTWTNVVGSYSHSSDDRNKVWTAKLSVASEYDYFSVGLGGSYSLLFNEKNTELGISGNVYFDQWNAIYPMELRPFGDSEQNINGSYLGYSLRGNPNYSPNFKAFNDEGRNTYAIGLSLSQILSRRMQGVLMADYVIQDGLLSTPFQRVYFKDVDNTYINDFHLAEGIEMMPGNRTKIAVGGRLNYYINEYLVLRTYLRYYSDDWGISSQTASIEIPIKAFNRITLYPSYRYYFQTAADYFLPYDQHLSTDAYYTSDYDLSEYTASQFSFGISYTDIFTKCHIGKYGVKNINLKISYYERDSGLNGMLIAGGVKFVLDK